MQQKVKVFPSSGRTEEQKTGPADHSETPERAELAKVLASGTFARSPRLSRILDYVCTKYLAGQTEQLKEYTIAVELFGRSEGFQPRDDASIRVDMNRLRKQLTKYYRGEGRQDPLSISIPSGQYAPVFSKREAGRATVAMPSGEVHEKSRTISSRRWWILTGLGLALVAVVVGSLVFLRTPPQSTELAAPASQRPESVPVAPSAPPGPELRILAGDSRDQSIDPFGNVWLGDRYFTGGSPISSPAGVGLTSPPRSQAETTWAREGDFTYHIPLRPGCYELRLYFIEWVYGVDSGEEAGGENFRTFDVFVNGSQLLPRFDIVADAGRARVPDVKVFTDISPASDGLLHMKFVSRRSKAIVSGIEVLPGIPGKIRPVRLACRPAPYRAADGTAWSADRFFHGGRIAERHVPISGTADTVLYQSERYGHFSYAIPVAMHGLYTVILGFSETYFGLGNPGEASKTERLFNVLCNGRILLKDFNVIQAAGGANRVLTNVFRHIEPSPQGKVLLDFVPVRDYACVNTIQVFSE